VDQGMLGTVARGQPLLVAQLSDQLRQQLSRDPDRAELLRSMKIDSYMCAPLIVGGRSLGALSWTATGRAFTAADLALLEELAHRAATLLDNARLYEATQALVRRLENIQSVTSELSRARTPAEVAAITARHGTTAVGGEACLIWLRDGEGGLTLLERHGVPELTAGAWQRLPAGSGAPALQVLETGEAMWIETEDEFRRAWPEIFEVQRAAGRLRAYAAIPLSIAGQRHGVVVFTFPTGHRFAPADREFLTTLTRQCEQALERAQLYATEASARAQAEEAQARAEAANRAKDEFLAMLGHELRNPLAPIVTALQLMKLRGDRRSSREQQVIERQVAHLLRLVDDLLDVSRITRGKVALKKEPVELAEAVAKAVEIVSPLLEEKRHQLSLSVPRGLRVDADVVRLAQVIANLLTNAARYTDAGGLIQVGALEDGGQVVLSVKDNGIGIDAEALPHVFDLFVQGTRSSDRGQGGLGIGLTLVRNLVAMHGGQVVATSAGLGHGSEFVVRLPALGRVEAGAGQALPRDNRVVTSRTRRILVVDDNADAAELLAEYLRQAGHLVALAHDGAQALRLVESFTPDVAILDIGLPVMDGYELAGRLRERLPLRLAALTGYGQEHDRARSVTAGFHAHFVKPISPEVLLEYIDS
jgi:signal transduction histidine kinase